MWCKHKAQSANLGSTLSIPRRPGGGVGVLQSRGENTSQVWDPQKHKGWGISAQVCFRFSTVLLTQDVFKSSWKEAHLSNPWSVLSVSAAYCKIKVGIWGLEGSCVNCHPNRSNQAVWKPSEIFRFLWLRAAEDPHGKVHGIAKAVLGRWTWQWCAIWERILSAAGQRWRHGDGQVWVDTGRPDRDVKTDILHVSSVDAQPSGTSLKESGKLERR